MFYRRILSLVLAFCLLFTLCACSGSDNPAGLESSPQDSSQEDPQIDLEQNPLTGEKNLSKDSYGKIPVAFTVNNADVAQKVQSGVGDADLVFETEVEGGITRLLAVFADPSKIKTLGTIRSLRVVYADIACGLDAFLVHHGIDPSYCAPHVKSIDLLRYNIDSPYAFRENNGLAVEHTLYTNSDKISKLIADKKYEDKTSSTIWANFTKEGETRTPSSVQCLKLKVPFSSCSITNFTYNSEENKYVRENRKGVPFTDYKTGEKELFTNVFVLKTTMSYYPDNYHRDISLSGGRGYYISNGGIEEISWSKGDSSDSFKFTTADGSKLEVNRGNSYVCIINDSREISFE